MTTKQKVKKLLVELTHADTWTGVHHRSAGALIDSYVDRVEEVYIQAELERCNKAIDNRMDELAPILETIGKPTPLTKRQKEVFDAITSFEEENGYFPTFKEIGGLIGTKNLSTVQYFMNTLVGKRWIIHIAISQ